MIITFLKVRQIIHDICKGHYYQLSKLLNITQFSQLCTKIIQTLLQRRCNVFYDSNFERLQEFYRQN